MVGPLGDGPLTGVPGAWLDGEAERFLRTSAAGGGEVGEPGTDLTGVALDGLEAVRVTVSEYPLPCGKNKKKLMIVRQFYHHAGMLLTRNDKSFLFWHAFSD